MYWADIWSSALQWVSQHSAITYPAIFFISMAESLALVGLLVPGTLLMVGIGALAGSGVLSLKITLLAAMAGAIAGDGISFWLGNHYQQEIRTVWPFHKYPQLLARGEDFFRRHGGKSVFLGRFVGPMRPVIPLIAGMLEMPIKHFLVVNILSAVGWAFAYIIPGVLLSSSLALVGAVSTRLSLLLLLLGLLLWVAFWLSKKGFWLLSHLGPKEERLLMPLLCLSLVLAGWLFLGVLEDLLTLDPLVQADQSIYQFLQSLRTPWGDQVMVAVTEMGDSLINAFTVAGVLLVLLFKRHFRAATYWVAAAAGGAGLVELFKWLLHRPRPIDIYHGVSSWGFPSGHTTMSVVLFGFLAILLTRSFSAPRRWLPFAAAISMSLLIAFSRMYLGAHWFSDILGGLSLGWGWATFLGIFYLRRPAKVLPHRAVVFSLVGMLLLVGSWHIQQRHSADIIRYQIQRPLQKLNFVNWQRTDWQLLPVWRIDFIGETEQPLTVQWTGDLETLATKLRRLGWEKAAENDSRRLLNFLVTDIEIQKLPLLPQLAGGHREQLCMALNQGKQRLVLRLWPSEFRISESDLPIWTGSLESEQAITTAGLLTVPKGLNNYSEALHFFEQELSG